MTVATDFSRGAHAATERALMLPLAPGAVLELVHAEPDGRADVDIGRLALEHLVQDVRARRPGLELEVMGIRKTGEIVDVLSHAMARRRTELLVIGRPSTRSLPRLVSLHVPTLVVLRPPREPYRRPLVALALDDTGPRALACSLRVLDAGIERIDVVHALHVPFEGLVTPGRCLRSSYREEVEAAAAESVNRILARHPAIEWTAHLARAETHSAVLATALALRSDLLIVGARERGRLARMLPPRLVSSVLAVSPCDLLIAPPEVP